MAFKNASRNQQRGNSFSGRFSGVDTSKKQAKVNFKWPMFFSLRFIKDITFTCLNCGTESKEKPSVISDNYDLGQKTHAIYSRLKREAECSKCKGMTHEVHFNLVLIHPARQRVILKKLLKEYEKMVIENKKLIKGTKRRVSRRQAFGNQLFDDEVLKQLKKQLG